MTMAGPLMLTSLPFRTSPVKRGAWLLETVFNRPPAEPKVAFVLEDNQSDDAIDLSELSVPPAIREASQRSGLLLVSQPHRPSGLLAGVVRRHREAADA